MPDGTFVSPWAFARPKPRRETKTFGDPLQPGLALTLTFQALADSGRRLRAVANAEELIDAYVGRDGTPPERAFPAPDDEDVEITGPLCRNIAVFMEMQVPPAGQAAYSFADWVGWSVMAPNLFTQIVIWAGSLMAGNAAPTPGEDPTPTPTIPTS